MRFALRLVMLWTAGLLLFAHSVVPHAHGTEHAGRFGAGNLVSERPSGKPLPIEADLGSDHLEHFRLDEENTTSPDACLVLATVPAAVPHLSGSCSDVEAVKSGLFPPVPELRAPVPAEGAGIRPPPALS